MNRFRNLVVAVGGLVAALTLAPGAWAKSSNTVYTLSNSPAGNAVLAFERGASGLVAAGSFATGGVGTGAALGSQGALVLTDDGNRLLGVNAGSNSVSLFAVRQDGLTLHSTVPSGGTLPISVTAHGSLVYVLNAGGTPSISGFRLEGGQLVPLFGSARPLAAGDAGPAEVAFTPNGRALVVTNKASSTIDTFAVGPGGLAGPAVASPSAGGTPFGFDFDRNGRVLVSNASGSASSYDWAAAGSLSVITGPVATHQGAPCWLVSSVDGRFAYTANAAAGSISGFSVAKDGSLALLDPTGSSAVIGVGSHPLDEAVSSDGRYLYDLADGLHGLRGFAIGADGSLAPDQGIDGLPAGAMGLAAS